MNWNFHAHQFSTHFNHILHIFRAKMFNYYSPDFSHFFTDRMTSESYTDSLKVISEGSMVEYLPVRSQGGSKIIIVKIYFRPLKTLKSLTPYPSPLCAVVSVCLFLPIIKRFRYYLSTYPPLIDLRTFYCFCL